MYIYMYSAAGLYNNIYILILHGMCYSVVFSQLCVCVWGDQCVCVFFFGGGGSLRVPVYIEDTSANEISMSSVPNDLVANQTAVIKPCAS